SDEGVAFIIEIGNKRIYHAGDLHWWHWIGEPDSDNNYQANTFKSEINKIKDLNFDLMMIPLDPRLEDSMHWGMDYILSHVKATYVLPMHFTDSPKKMLESIDNEPLCRYNNIIKIHNEGEIFILGE
ncbi:MAG TPA: MBL fold metallo-hydrolase, partial [[Clostridium] spiroforme]|nr:MBL fold metallo-hydrolase [Thomasclavelia spiroformis]